MPTQPLNFTLAQSSAIGNDYWIAIALLLVALTFGALLLFAVRKKLFSADDSIANAPGGGLLEHLDHMKNTGQITKEEYDATRSSIIEKAAHQIKADKHLPDDHRNDQTNQ